MIDIRPYRSDDLEALYDICLRTGSSGRDATGLVEDARLFGALFAAPYGVLEPEHAFVLDDGSGKAIGYVVGALDTLAFEARCEAEWWPPLRALHPLQPNGTRLDDLLIHLIHDRSTPDPALVAAYPSHLHIDLLTSGRGAGWGRRMMATLYSALAADGSPGVHWGVSTHNVQAIGFYRHLGATELADDGAIITFGERL